MRIEGIVLKHDGDVAIGRIDIIHDPSANADGAARDALSPATMRKVVDFLLDGPSRIMNSPSRISSETSRTA